MYFWILGLASRPSHARILPLAEFDHMSLWANTAKMDRENRALIYSYDRDDMNCSTALKTSMAFMPAMTRIPLWAASTAVSIMNMYFRLEITRTSGSSLTTRSNTSGRFLSVSLPSSLWLTLESL